MTAAQDSLRLTAEAIVEAAALDGDRTAVDATVRERSGLVVASLDLTIGGWFATATSAAESDDDAVRDCLRSLEVALARRADDTTRRVRAALAAALSEVPS